MRYLLLPLLLSTLISNRGHAQIRLSVSSDGSHLVYTDEGRPFFYLGDTAWELLHRADREEIKRYLEDRAAKGYNVIQTVVLAELDGLTDPNPYGQLPLIDRDPERPNEAYFAHVDYAVGLADSLGIFLGLLPTWGDKFNKKWGVGPEVFTPENARSFGAYLAGRYRDNNIIWILGGDRNPEEAEDFTIVRGLAAGILSVTNGEQLMTYHPQGGYRSTDFFPEDEWLDFHMFQTGHGRYDDKANYDFPREARRVDPNKPVINGEPAYEDHPVNWRPVNGWFDDFDTRQAAWWSVLAGTAGHTFGNHNIWQMYRPGRTPISSARTDWHEALHYPAAAQIGYLGTLMDKIPYWELAPDFNYLDAPPNSSGREVVLARGEKSGLVVAYTPYGDVLRVDKAKQQADFTAEWFDPRTGNSFQFTPGDGGEQWVFDPPLDPRRGNDWVLVLRAD